jgi:hypothetical protein
MDKVYTVLRTSGSYLQKRGCGFHLQREGNGLLQKVMIINGKSV